MNLQLDYSWFLILEFKFLLIFDVFLTQSWTHSLVLFVIIFVIMKWSWLLSFLSSSLLSSKLLESILIHHHEACFYMECRKERLVAVWDGYGAFFCKSQLKVIAKFTFLMGLGQVILLTYCFDLPHGSTICAFGT